ncbi:MAG: DUF1016 family protein [Ignavibacteriales bacterium]|nr:DUF1016 family protein [Ignavibacteriales bacterium]
MPKKTTTILSHFSKNYDTFLSDLKRRIREAQTKAALSVNRELLLLYWHIGKQILQQQAEEGWGAKVIERLSLDLCREFPEMKGFSQRNLKYMRAFAEEYRDEQFVQEVLAQITWYHNITLLDKVENFGEREWYVYKTIENGWSRNILVHQIESGLYERSGKAITNFSQTLPSPQSELAQQLLKDPYTFDFLSLSEQAMERDLEKALREHLTEFLLELGVGFAFVGNQFHLEVGEQDFYLDLLFYHIRLHCYVAIELKMTEFQPEFAGKMNFYLSAIDEQLRTENDEPTIGMILCKSKNKLVVEYALRDVKKPIGVSSYRLTSSLPKNLKGNLPTMKQLETEFIKKTVLKK